MKQNAYDIEVIFNAIIQVHRAVEKITKSLLFFLYDQGSVQLLSVGKFGQKESFMLNWKKIRHIHSNGER